MHTSVIHRSATALVPAIVLGVAVVAAALTAPAAAEQPEYPFTGVVTGENVYVRSGPADSYYPIGRVHRGDLVKVTGQRFNWMRIVAVGPAFADTDRFFGFVVYPTIHPGRFRLDEDGAGGVTLGRTDVLGPNLNARFDPAHSWKPLVRLGANERVTVLTTDTTENNTVHRIALPETAEVWISRAYIAPAGDADLDRWERALRGEDDVKEEVEKVAEAKSDEQETEKEVARRDVDDDEAGRRADEPVKAAARDDEAEPADDAQAEAETERGVVQQPAARPHDPLPAADEQPAPEDAPAADEADKQPEADAPEESAAAKADEDDAAAERAAQIAEMTIEDLEHAYEQLREEGVTATEARSLRQMYLAFAEHNTDEAAAVRFAEVRAEQLALLADLHERQEQLARLRERARVAAEKTEAARLAADAAGDYTAVGRLAVSAIFDGRRLPQLLRLREPGTGRTVAYIEPSEQFELLSMVDQLIGVVGEKSYDAALRLNVIEPRRIDILAPR